MRSVTQKTITKVDTTTSYTCDRCGKPCGRDERHRTFEVKEVRLHAVVEHEEGGRYPEGASTEQIEVDCCSNCFLTVVIPALKALGFKPVTVDRSY